MRTPATLRCGTCGIDILLDTAPDGSPGVLWFLDARGHVLERGTMGEGHVQLTGDARLGSNPGTVHCPGPVLPATIDLRDPVAAVADGQSRDSDAVVVIDLTGTDDLSDLTQGAIAARARPPLGR
jgi:hypothetical protein